MTWNVASGEATITAGNTYVDKAHGLGLTPDINNIHLTPKQDLTGFSFWVSNVGASTFRINIGSAFLEDVDFGYIILYET